MGLSQFTKPKLVVILSSIFALIVVAFGGAFVYFKNQSSSSFSISNGKTESVNLQDINADSSYPQFNFQTPHEIKINGKFVGAEKDYKLKNSDLIEGENKIEVSSVKEYFNGLKVKDTDSKRFSLMVDRVRPELKFQENPAAKIYLKESVPLKFISEQKAKFFLNNSETSGFESSELQLQIPLKFGQNTNTFHVTDSAGNKSNDLVYNSEAFSPSEFQEVRCGEIKAYVNLKNLQVGFEPMPGLVDTLNVNDTQLLDQLVSSSKKCTDKDNIGVDTIWINKIGSFIRCLYCEEFSDSGFRLTHSFNPKPEINFSSDQATRTEGGEYTNPFGIKGELYKTDFPNIIEINREKAYGSTKGFNFKLEGEDYSLEYNYYLNTDPNAEKDFMELVDLLHI